MNGIHHDFSCDVLDNICESHDHRIDIGIYYSELVHVLTTAADASIPIVPKQAMKHYWSATLNDLTMNSKDAYDLWVLSGKPQYGCVFDIMKDAKYKYKLAVRDAIVSYEDQFSDDLLKHLSSIDMNAFWKTWSAKTRKKSPLD